MTACAGTPLQVRLNERLGIAAAFVLLELVGAMTRDAVLAFAKSVAAYRNKYDCGYRGPNGSLSNGILKAVPFEELSGENHCKCADEDNEELLEPELEAHKVSEKCLTTPNQPRAARAEAFDLPDGRARLVGCNALFGRR